jgi:hypothetical protein
VAEVGWAPHVARQAPRKARPHSGVSFLCFLAGQRTRRACTLAAHCEVNLASTLELKLCKL